MNTSKRIKSNNNNPNIRELENNEEKIVDYTQSIGYAEQEILRHIGLIELIEQGNRFAKYQQINHLTGNKYNFLALMRQDNCKHFDSDNAIIEVTFTEGFMLYEKICTQCGKVIQLTIKKVED